MIHPDVYMSPERLEQVTRSHDLACLRQLLEFSRQASPLDLMEGVGSQVAEALSAILVWHAAEVADDYLRTLSQLRDFTTYGWINSGDEERIDYSRPLDVELDAVRELAERELQRRGQAT